MEKIIYNQIADKNYIGIITVLDYETSVRKCLSNILICTRDRRERRVIVDLALKVGMNEYRFVVYDIADTGSIIWNTSKYLVPSEGIIELANSFIRQRGYILPNSMLPSTVQSTLLRS